MDDSLGKGLPVKVLVVGNYPPDGQQSMLRFGTMLVDNLRLIGVAVDYIQPAPVFGRWCGGNARGQKIAGYFDKYLLFPMALMLRARRYRVVHIIDHSNALYVGFAGVRKTLVTCHDLFAVRILLGDIAASPWGLNGRMLQRLILRGLRRVSRFTAVSDATADDLVRLVPGHPAITVIPNALAGAFVPDHVGAAPAPDAQTAPYFLHVGGNQFYKNRPGVVRLFNHLAQADAFAGVRLVLAGKEPDDALATELARSPVRDRIDVLIAPDDATVRALYAGALALLFISLTEGFGWPVIEAQASGCPVVTSDRDPMRAIAGGAAVLVDPKNPAAAALAIVAAKDRFAALRQDGRDNARAYYPDEIYPRYIPIYREIAAR